MFSHDHIVGYTLSAVIHLLGFLLVGLQVLRHAEEAQTLPELDVTSVALSLAEETDDLPGASQAAARAEAPEVPTLELPAPVEPPPPSEPTEKVDFSEALPLPPEPVPQPRPQPVLKPAPAPQPPKPQAPRPASAPDPSAKTASATQTATIEPSSGSGGAAGQIDAHPSLDRPIKPVYPIGARRRGEEGTVILDVSVAADGHAERIALVASSGFPDLDRAAERAASQARFKPGTRDGRAVPSAARLTLIFRLRDH